MDAMNKPLATIIIGKKAGIPEGAEEENIGDYREMLDVATEEILGAFEAKDKERLRDALQAFIEIKLDMPKKDPSMIAESEDGEGL